MTAFSGPPVAKSPTFVIGLFLFLLSTWNPSKTAGAGPGRRTMSTR